MQLPPRTRLVLIGGFEIGLGAGDRIEAARVRKFSKVRDVGRIAHGGAREPRITHSHTEGILRTITDGLVHHDARVHAETQEIPIRFSCAHHAAKRIDGFVGIIAMAPEHLVRNGVERPIPVMPGRSAVA